MSFDLMSKPCCLLIMLLRVHKGSQNHFLISFMIRFPVCIQSVHGLILTNMNKLP